MLTEEPEAYASTIRSMTLSYVVVVGEVIVSILAIAGLIAFGILRGELVSSIIDVIIYVFLPLTVLVVVYAVHEAKKVYRQALEFYRTAKIVSEEFDLKHVELLESPAPPFAAIYRINRKYLVLRRLDKYATISILDPIRGVGRKEYTPILLWRERERLFYKEVDGVRIKISRVEAYLPDPKNEEMVEGLFIAYTTTTIYNTARIVKILRKLLSREAIEYYETTRELPRFISPRENSSNNPLGKPHT